MNCYPHTLMKNTRKVFLTISIFMLLIISVSDAIAGSRKGNHPDQDRINNESQVLTLHDILHEALTANPDIDIVQARLRASRAAVWQAQTAFSPRLELLSSAADIYHLSGRLNRDFPENLNYMETAK